MSSLNVASSGSGKAEKRKNALAKSPPKTKGPIQVPPNVPDMDKSDVSVGSVSLTGLQGLSVASSIPTAVTGSGSSRTSHHRIPRLCHDKPLPLRRSYPCKFLFLYLGICSFFFLLVFLDLSVCSSYYSYC